MTRTNYIPRSKRYYLHRCVKKIAAARLNVKHRRIDITEEDLNHLPDVRKKWLTTLSESGYSIQFLIPKQ